MKSEVVDFNSEGDNHDKELAEVAAPCFYMAIVTIASTVYLHERLEYLATSLGFSKLLHNQIIAAVFGITLLFCIVYAMVTWAYLHLNLKEEVPARILFYGYNLKPIHFKPFLYLVPVVLGVEILILILA